MKLNNFQPFQNNAFLHGWLSLAFLLFGLMPNYAQISCGGGNVSELCLRYPAQSYTCIDGNYDAPSLYGDQLLTPAQALNNPQYLLIKGQVTFTGNYTFAEGSNIVFLDNNSGFRVEGGVELKLERTELNGCTKLWAGIEVLVTGRIRVNQCTFEDAKAAIILRNASNIEVTHNVFRKNYCGIVGVSSNTSNPDITSSITLAGANGISGNIFYGDDELLETVAPIPVVSGLIELPAHSTKRPYAGIWLERINALTIGHLADDAAAPVNVFRDFGLDVTLLGSFATVAHGINAIRSNIVVKNCEFENIGVYIPGGSPQQPQVTIQAAAISATNFSLQMCQTTVAGHPRVDMFRNCYYDVYARGTNLSVTGVNSRHSYSSIDVGTAGSLQAPINVVVKNNKIDYFRKNGILVTYARPISINIENNKIFDNDQLNDPVERFGIRLGALFPATEIRFKKSARIFNNQIKSRSQLFGGVFYGIAVSRSSYIDIELNTITDEHSPSNLSEFFGIITLQSPCNGLLIRYNSVKGASINYAERAFGLVLNESINSIVNCNFTDKINTGMAFLRNCDNTDLRTNDFKYHGIGLSVGHPSVLTALFNQIGLQQNKENRWIGSDSPIEAFAVNEASALASIFRINSTNFNSGFWPSPRKIGTNDDNGIWFLPSTSGPPATDSECFIEGPSFPEPEPEPRLAGTGEEIINETYQEPWGFAALDWEARWHFSDRLFRNPELQDINTQVAAYYQATYQDSYSSLNRLYQGYLNRWRPGHPLTQQLDYHQEMWRKAVEQRFEIDEMLSYDPAANDSVHAQMLQADELIQAWADSLHVTVSSLNDTVNQQTASYLSELENISCQQAYDEDMKKVLRIFLQFHAQEGQPDSSQLAELSAIAGKCRYSGGYAVVLARSLFEPQDNYPQDANCQFPQLRMDAGPADAAGDFVQVFPNPAAAFTNISVQEPFEQGVVRVYNTQGMLMRSYILEGAFTQIPLGQLEKGIYLLEVILDRKISARKKMVKTQ